MALRSNADEITEAFNAHNLDAIMESFAEDCSLDKLREPEPWGTRLVGKEAVRAGLATRFEGLSDVHYGDGRHRVRGALGVSEWLLTGTKVDGQSVRVRGCDHWKFRDGDPQRSFTDHQPTDRPSGSPLRDDQQ
jgi:ketosteroid isomerase-like protein